MRRTCAKWCPIEAAHRRMNGTMRAMGPTTTLAVWSTVLALSVLGMIAWEDLRDRAIHWWWLPLLAALLLGTAGHVTQALDALWNLGFLAVQLSAAGLWLLARGRSLGEARAGIGTGDLMFFVVVALGLPRAEFVPWHLSGLCLSLAAHLLWVRLRPTADRTIPLAGYLAVHLGLWLVVRPWWPGMLNTLLLHGH